MTPRHAMDGAVIVWGGLAALKRERKDGVRRGAGGGWGQEVGDDVGFGSDMIIDGKNNES